MKILTKTIPYDSNIFEFGDVHTGSIMSHEEGFEQLTDMINSSYDGLPATRNFAIDHGDMIEGILIDDPRFDDRATRGNIIAQIESAVNMRKPFRNKLIVCLEGNHERKLWRLSGLPRTGVAAEICKQLDVPFGTFSCKINFMSKNGDLLFKQYATHGKKSINSTADDPKRRKTNMELILKRHLKFKMSDAILMSKGHTHKLIKCEPEKELYIIDVNGSLKQRYTSPSYTDDYIHPDSRWYINTGSFLKMYGDGFSGYAEEAEYDPVELGFWIVRVRDGKIAGIDKIILKSMSATIDGG